MTIRFNFLIACACVVFGAQVFAAETNSISPPPPADATAQSVLNGYLQIQEQLHATQIALENSREEAAAAAQRNADEMAARIQTLEQTIATQRASDVGAAQKTQQLTLSLVAAFGSAGLAIMLLMVYFQWRVVKQLVELPALQPSAFALGSGHTPMPGMSFAVEQSSARLFSTVDHLEKRILGLEQAVRVPLAEKKPHAARGKNGADSNDREECVANLMAEGQSLLNANEPEKAMECFDVALGLNPRHAEALIKKGGALEKLARLDEAIACYDRAIEADAAMTVAYLQKGGLFNRMARYDEALKCYEQALRTQEKNVAAETVSPSIQGAVPV
jgi:tetratricopeptide (TPR) repeat protein